MRHGLTRAIRPQPYNLSTLTRPHIYLPLHGPTLGSDPADRTYLDDKAGRLANNGGSALLATPGVMNDYGTAPESVWTTKPGWFVPGGTTNSVFREQMGISTGLEYPIQQLFANCWGVQGGMLAALWVSPPTSNPDTGPAHFFDAGCALTGPGKFGIEIATTGNISVRYNGNSGQRTFVLATAPAANVPVHLAVYFNFDDNTYTPYLNGVVGTAGALITPLSSLVVPTTNMWFSLAARSAATPTNLLNAGAGGVDCGFSDFLIINYGDNPKHSDIPAAVLALGKSPRGDIPRKLALL